MGDSNPTKPLARPRQVTGTQVMFAVIVAIGLMLAINFSGRVSADRQLSDVYEQVTLEIELLKREQSLLIERLGYVESDAYVEDWARSQGRMVREGEVLIIPIPAQASASAAVAQGADVAIPIETGVEPEAPWQLWWALFFDVPPPEL